MRRNAHVAAAAALVLAAAPAAAQELLVGFGADDIRGAGTTAAFGVEYRATPRWTVGTAPVGLAIAADIDARGDVWGGAGLVATVPIGGGVRLEASAMPGASSRIERNGSDRARATLRTRLGLSVELPRDWRAGVTFTHRASGGGGRPGPGVMVTLNRDF